MTTSSLRTAPPFDAELAPILEELSTSIPSTLTPEHLDALRGPGFTPLLPELLEGRPIRHEERTIDGPGGPLLVSIFRPLEPTADAPGFFFTHVGGMIFGDRFVGIAPVVDYVVAFGATVVSVEYRLAPEHPAPAALDDSYAALVWTAEHADELGFSADRLFAIGGSAGGGVAAGITLMARDRNYPPSAGQVLMYPMLDEDNDSVSAQQIDGIGVWDRTSNETGWNFLLGDRRHTDQVTAYASPSKAASLAGLPPTYIEVGSAEVFRDEDVAYASGIWAAGGIAELHVWPGGFHLFELIAPQSRLALAAKRSRDGWVARMLGFSAGSVTAE
jgi:acetyl esterase/lipase